MRVVRETLGTLIILVAVGLILRYAIFARFENPDATEMRLFLNYWPQYIAIIVLLFLGAILREWGKER